MPKLRAFVTMVLATALSGSAMAARPSNITDHVSQIDGPLKMMTGPNGRSVAAWAYRASGEFDIAVSTRESGAASWSTPVFFGRRSGADELEPTMTFDARGAAYVAFSTANPSRVALAILPADAKVWTEPFIVSGADVASSPSLRLVGDRLVVAYLTARGIGMVDIPVAAVANQVNGIQDGPDGVDPLGVKGKTATSDVTPVVPPGGPHP